jgi:hypothetical protein
MSSDIKRGKYRPRVAVRVASENYKGVQIRTDRDGGQKWIARMKNGNSRTFDTEREAAIAVDKSFIMAGLEPPNILKKKNNDQ